ncbi:hypothetical protein [Pedobacter sp. ASV28]|uniref:hypothetical protein n=1 Tax=Pedobacter sp. ASV28 TaxID=2795123 RepID=UPI0018EA3392|nr:hypothetical protein [Pedobacter sp. ASV28]
MKYAFLLFTFLFGSIVCQAQLQVKEAIGSIGDIKLPDPKEPLYEDDKYVVRRTCSGEWGGTAWFKNKQTNIEYSCAAVCPISVNKIDGTYYVTSTLMHLIGFSTIVEIKDPDSMEVFVLPPARKIKGKRVRYVGEAESGSTLGVVMLAESAQKVILGSFIDNGILYHLMRGYKEVYVATIKDKELTKVLQVLAENVNPMHIPFKRENELFIPFVATDNNIKGYIKIVGNIITVVRPKA